MSRCCAGGQTGRGGVCGRVCGRIFHQGLGAEYWLITTIGFTLLAAFFAAMMVLVLGGSPRKPAGPVIQ